MKPFVKAAGAIFTVLGLMSGIGSVSAHHSASMYDETLLTTINGTVKEVRWVNPHVSLLILGAAKEGGEPAEWLLETTSPGRLLRLGWARNSVKAGDGVVIEIHPLREGALHGGSIQKVTSVETGKTFGTNIRELDSPDKE
jgi:Family of unknown function (DUF6152)